MAHFPFCFGNWIPWHYGCRNTMYLSHLWDISTCPMIFVFLQSINQPSHPRLVPFDLILDLILRTGLLAHNVSACSDNCLSLVPAQRVSKKVTLLLQWRSKCIQTPVRPMAHRPLHTAYYYCTTTHSNYKTSDEYFLFPNRVSA